MWSCSRPHRREGFQAIELRGEMVAMAACLSIREDFRRLKFQVDDDQYEDAMEILRRVLETSDGGNDW